MTLGYCTVAMGNIHESINMMLFGVGLSSAQSGMGESSTLAMASFFGDKAKNMITMWSSGTGFAGVAGYAWVVTLHQMAGLEYPKVLALANILTLAWLFTFHRLLKLPKTLALLELNPSQLAPNNSNAGTADRALYESIPSSDVEHASPREGGGSSGREQQQQQQQVCTSCGGLFFDSCTPRAGDHTATSQPLSNVASGTGVRSRCTTTNDTEEPKSCPSRFPCGETAAYSSHHNCTSGRRSPANGVLSIDSSAKPHKTGGVPLPPCKCKNPSVVAHKAGSVARSLSSAERGRLMLSLWPYMIPLLVVYMSEYAMQSGVWSSIGFPLSDTNSRTKFYALSNWTYQAGVFISRSSGMIYQATRGVLWMMPAMQFGLLIFFIHVAAFPGTAFGGHLYSWWLLVPCFIAGLLGGGVYVNAFTLIAAEVPEDQREFSLSAASVADSLGICLADLLGVLIQGCLWKLNGLPGAGYSCSWA